MNLQTKVRRSILFMIVAGFAAIVGLAAVPRMQPASLEGIAMLSLLTLGPPGVSLFLVSFCKRAPSLSILLVSSCLYAALFIWDYCYMIAFPDPGVFAFLLTGVFSLPVLIPVWIVAFFIRKKGQEISTSFQP